MTVLERKRRFWIPVTSCLFALIVGVAETLLHAPPVFLAFIWSGALGQLIALPFAYREILRDEARYGLDHDYSVKGRWMLLFGLMLMVVGATAASFYAAYLGQI